MSQCSFANELEPTDYRSVGQHKRPKVQRNFERRMQFIFTERLYDDLMLAIKEIRSDQKQEANECNAADVWNID
jgi:hypothetical protein